MSAVARVSHSILRVEGGAFLTAVTDKGEVAFDAIYRLRLKDTDPKAGMTWQDLRAFPKFCRPSLAYVLSYGRPERIPSNPADKWYQARHPIVRQVINGVIGTALSGGAIALWQYRLAIARFIGLV